MGDRSLGPGHIAVQDDDIVAEQHQAIDEMAPDEPSPAGYEYPFLITFSEQADRWKGRSGTERKGPATDDSAWPVIR